MALTVLYSLGVILLDVPRVIAHPSVFVTWYGAAEQLALAAGELVAYAYCARLEPATAERLSKIGHPTIFIDPHIHFNWAENAINLALIGSAWVIAASIPAVGKSKA